MEKVEAISQNCYPFEGKWPVFKAEDCLGRDAKGWVLEGARYRNKKQNAIQKVLDKEIIDLLWNLGNPHGLHLFPIYHGFPL